jgi:hypothetical protein
MTTEDEISKAVPMVVEAYRRLAGSQQSAVSSQHSAVSSHQSSVSSQRIFQIFKSSQLLSK